MAKLITSYPYRVIVEAYSPKDHNIHYAVMAKDDRQAILRVIKHVSENPTNSWRGMLTINAHRFNIECTKDPQDITPFAVRYPGVI
jgi:hypothetical protein